MHQVLRKHGTGQMAALAAFENGTNDPYKSARFFGPKLWGKSEVAKGRC